MAASLIPRRCPTGGFKAAFSEPIRSKITRISARSLHTSVRSCKPGAAAAAEATQVRPYEDIPGPKRLPFIGNALSFLPKIGESRKFDIEEFFGKLFHQYGPIVKISGIPGRKDMVLIYNTEDVEKVFRNEGPWPYRDGAKCMEYYRNVTKKDYYADAGSVATDNGPKWLETRSKVNQPMMQPKITRRYVAPIDSVAQEFIGRMRSLKDEKDEMPHDFVNELFKWALESIACVALDTRLGCLAPDLRADSEPQILINVTHTVLDKMYDMEFGVPFWKIFPTPSWRAFVKALDTISAVTTKYVNEALQRIEKQKAEGVKEDGHSVLERLLGTAGPKTAAVMAQDLLFGGIDTTSYSSAVALYMLSKNQDKQELLYQDLKRFLPNKDSEITEEKWENMKFLKACFKECSRLKPIVSAHSRITVKEIIISNYRVPEGVSIAMPNTNFRENEEMYPFSKRFIPERWLKTRPSECVGGSAEDYDAVSTGKKQPFALLPFGFGPRSCVARRFAELEMEILVAKIIRNFNVEYKHGEMEFESKMLNMTKSPLKFKLTERTD